MAIKEEKNWSSGNPTLISWLFKISFDSYH